MTKRERSYLFLLLVFTADVDHITVLLPHVRALEIPSRHLPALHFTKTPAVGRFPQTRIQELAAEGQR